MRMINQYKNDVSLLNSACISLLSVRGSCFRLLSAIGLLSGFIITPPFVQMGHIYVRRIRPRLLLPRLWGHLGFMTGSVDDNKKKGIK